MHIWPPRGNRASANQIRTFPLTSWEPPLLNKYAPNDHILSAARMLTTKNHIFSTVRMLTTNDHISPATRMPPIQIFHT